MMAIAFAVLKVKKRIVGHDFWNYLVMILEVEVNVVPIRSYQINKRPVF